jgi:hypothetical protein
MHRGAGLPRERGGLRVFITGPRLEASGPSEARWAWPCREATPISSRCSRSLEGGTWVSKPSSLGKWRCLGPWAEGGIEPFADGLKPCPGKGSLASLRVLQGLSRPLWGRVAPASRPVAPRVLWHDANPGILCIPAGTGAGPALHAVIASAHVLGIMRRRPVPPEGRVRLRLDQGPNSGEG